jgi:hypothetical protein
LIPQHLHDPELHPPDLRVTHRESHRNPRLVYCGKFTEVNDPGQEGHFFRIDC